MHTTNVDYIYTYRYILESLKKNDLNVAKAINDLNQVELDEHHKDDLKVNNEKDLAFKAYDCLQHLSDVRKKAINVEFESEVKIIDELVQKHIFNTD